GVIWGGVALAVLLSLPLLGCGGDEESAGNSVTRTEQVEPQPTASLPPDLPAVAQEDVAAEGPAAPATVEQREVDRAVTFEEAE
ncbi:MAG: hypothetical protein GWN99_02150, partial [Gemmatimonadetes bacterium]|nr:hypothetical protein [Gemmatimonadota bacterium]NIW35737.1 hypothetical protein [Gemmatimonadota bacterium]